MLPNKDYGNKYDIAETFSVSAFTVVTTGVTPPSAVSLCGDLTYTPKFDGAVIDNDDQPLAYNSLSYTIQNSGTAFFNTTKEYSLTAEFTNWPTA